jgi:uncharacterized Zn-finger protein
MKPFQVIEIDSMEVACEGDGGPLGHPRVFLHIDKKNGHIQCPYCSRLYVLKGQGELKTA